ncbi:MAG: Ig-like domain-containing protein [Lachnospiraceae bacterium]|nr:Ig-like domain-containing protein [Lachnospiraceae bacterium]
MKTFKKVLASTLAAAMVVTALPVTPANAAAAPKLSTTKAAVYVGQSKTIKVTTPKTWKSVKVKATTSKKSVATVKTSKKKVTVKAIKAGTAKVTVKVTGKKGKKAEKKTLKATITVKNPTLAVSAANVVAVGSTEAVKATVKPANAKISYKTSDDTIATVDAKGVVTGVKAGDVTITVSAKSGKKTVSKDVKMAVKNYVLTNVTQAKLTELTATVAGDTKNLKASDFTIKNATTNVVYPVSKVTVDAKDATKVTLTLFGELKDAANYDVTLDGVTKSFKASDGKVINIALNTATVPYATETEIKLVSKDANGVVIDEVAYGTPNASYDFAIDAKGNGYTNGSKLYLNKVGDTAEATITYKSGKYDQNGKPEGNIGPNKVTITAVEQSAISNFAVRIDSGKASFDKAKDTNKIAAGETKTAYFQIKNADNKEIATADYATYTVESSDKTVLMLASSSIASKQVGVTAVKSGTAYILFKNKDGKIVNSVAVDVVAARAVATLDLDNYAVSVSKKLGRSANVVATLKDQYGDDMTAAEASKLVVTCLTKPDGAAGTAFSQSGKTITFTTTDVKGTYVFKIAYVKDGKEVVAKTVTVSVVDTTATTATSWKLNVGNNNVDIKVDENHKTSQAVTVEMIGSAEGVELYAVPNVTYTVKKADGTVIYNNIAGSATVTNSAIAVSGGALTVNALTVSDGATKVATKNIGAGTYTVIAKGVDGTNTANITTTFTIKDTQAKASVEVKKNAVDADTLANELGQALVVTYGDNIYTNNTSVTNRTSGLTITEAKIKLNNGTEETDTTKTIASGKYYSVSKLVVNVTVATGVTMNMEVSVPGVITVK